MAKKVSKKSKAQEAKPAFGVIGPYTDEQAKGITESIRDRHSDISLEGSPDRPDFYVTTDIRATSDPLWQSLFAFRRRLIEGGTFTPANWQSDLLNIREGAYEAGLRPHLGEVQYIAASMSEAIEGDPQGSWDDEPGGWSRVILTACGQAGWIQRHDLLDGFTIENERVAAIEWAESWMNARERQLCEPNLKTELKAALDEILSEPAVDDSNGKKRGPRESGPRLTAADRAFLVALSEVKLPLLGVELALRAGYSDFRRPMKRLVDYGLATKPSSRSGYEITTAGREFLETRP